MTDQFRDQINSARRAGYSDDEIVSFLKDRAPKISQALTSGYKAGEILDFLAPAPTFVEEAARKVGVAARGASEALAPVAAGAATGFALGGPVGAGVGALAGGLAMPAADVLTAGYNKLFGGNVQLPSRTVSEMLPGPRAESPAERVIQSSAGALGGTGGSVAAGRALTLAPQVLLKNQVVGNLANRPNAAFTAQPIAPEISAIGQEAARRPIGQLVTAPIATAVGQTTTEATDNPLLGLAAGIAAGVLGSPRPVKRSAVPTADELAARSKANYDILDKSNFQLDNDLFTSHMSQMPAKLRASAGYDPRTMPKVDAALAQLAAGNPKTVQELDTLRTIINGAAKSGDAPERLAAKQLLDEFDDYVMNAPANAIIAGDKKAIAAWKDARADYAKMKKSEMITDIIEKADVSQGSKEANIASQLSALAKNEKKMRFFTADEQQAIREAAKGGTMQQLLRTVSKFTPMTPAAAIFTAVNPLGAYTAAAGLAAKNVAEANRVRQVNRLASQMRLGETPQVEEGVFYNTPVFFSRGVQNMLGPTQQNQNALAK